MKREINIQYDEYNSVKELNQKEVELLKMAENAANNSYAPYSNFNVGAAVLMDNGEIITAANQENAAYPSGLCAERSAIFYAHSKYPDSAITAIAVTAKQNGKVTDSPATPCGSCRQVLSESQKRGGKQIEIILGGTKKILVFKSLEDILPFTFDNLYK